MVEEMEENHDRMREQEVVGFNLGNRAKFPAIETSLVDPRDLQSDFCTGYATQQKNGALSRLSHRLRAVQEYYIAEPARNCLHGVFRVKYGSRAAAAERDPRRRRLPAADSSGAN